MKCPKCDAEMFAYDKGLLEEKFSCKSCGEKLDKSTAAKEVLAIVGALATIAAAFIGLGK